MRQLRDLEPWEVSLVNKGANKKRFLVFKNRKGSPVKNIEAIKKAIAGAKDATAIEKILKTEFPESPENSIGKEASGEDGGMDPRAQMALKAAGRILEPHKDKITADHIKGVCDSIGIGAGKTKGELDHDEKQPTEKTEAPLMKMDAPEGVEGSHHGEAMEEAEKSYKTHLAKLGYQKYPEKQPEAFDLHKSKKDDDEDDEEDDVEKKDKVAKSDDMDLSSVAPALRPHLEAIFKSNKELIQKNEDLAKELKAERDIRLNVEFEQRANSFKHIGGDKKELATIMKSMSEKDPEGLKVFEKVLKANDEQIAKGDLFKTVGTSRSGGGDSEASLNAQIEANVKEIVAKSSGKSYEKAYDEYITKNETGRALYAQAKAARPGGA